MKNILYGDCEAEQAGGPEKDYEYLTFHPRWFC